MKTIELVSVIVVLAVVWLFPVPTVAARLLLTVFSLLFLFIFFGGPRRIREKKHADRLRALPRQTVSGYIADLRSYDTGKKKYISVSDGTTMEIGGDWSIYEHSHTETYPVYDGDILSLASVRNGEPFMKFRTLPSYVDGTEHKLKYSLNPIEVTYITDTDGTNYCLFICPIDVL